MLRVHNHREHQGCPLEVDVLVFGGSDTQTWKGHNDLSWFGSQPYVQQYSDLRVKNVQSWDYNRGNQKSLVEIARCYSNARQCSSTASKKPTFSSWGVFGFYLAISCPVSPNVLLHSLGELRLPLYSEEDMMYKSVWLLVYGLCTRCMSPLLQHGRTQPYRVGRSHTVPRPPPNAAATALALDHQGLSAEARPPPG